MPYKKGYKRTPEQIEHSKQAVKKWRASLPVRTHCQNGHEMTEENTYTDKRGYKGCKTCRLEALHKRRKALSSIDRKRIAEVGYKWNENNKEARSINGRIGGLRAYGLTPDDYNQMFENQKGRCALCNKHQSELNKILSIDHNHDNGKIRSLLCNNCNSGLGFFKDDEELLLKAADYLRKHNQKELTTNISLN